MSGSGNLLPTEREVQSVMLMSISKSCKQPPVIAYIMLHLDRKKFYPNVLLCVKIFLTSLIRIVFNNIMVACLMNNVTLQRCLCLLLTSVTLSVKNVLVDNFSYDYVEIFDGKDTSAPKIGKYCGNGVSIATRWS